MNRRANTDEGAILALTLAFLVVMVLLVIVPLGFAEANLKATISLRGNADLQATARSALDATVDWFRGRTDQGTAFQGTSGAQPCPWTASPNWGSPGWDPAAFSLNGWTVTVTCEGALPAGGFESQQRDVVFTVTCKSAPSGDACPTNNTLIRARYLFFDPPTYSSQVTQVSSWSGDF